MRVADVVVVGAGPAGVATAVHLARAGRAVVLADRARFPRDKCCGDGLTAAALRELEALGLDPAAVAQWTPVPAAWVRSPSGRTVELPLPDGNGHGMFAVVAPRLHLDAALVDVARRAGVDVHDGHGLVGAQEPDGERVVVHLDGLGPVIARYAVGADGMWSPLRKALGLGQPGYLGEWHALRQYATGVTGSAAERLWVWFEPELLPGYAWSFPVGGGQANVGFGVWRGGAVPTREMGPRWADLLGREHIRAALGEGAHTVGAVKAWPIPARIDKVVLGAGRALFAGDATAAADPLTGEGIAQALVSGRRAAEAIVAAGAEHPEDAQRRYRQAVQCELVADHQMSMVLGRVLRRSWGARGAIRAAGATAWTRRSFARWMFEDEPRAAALTPRRWHPDFLARPGAYATDGRSRPAFTAAKPE